MKKRFLLKLSGEILKGSNDSGISLGEIDSFCKNLAMLINKTKVELGVVVGGGNIFRGGDCNLSNYDRISGDYIGMMATVINGLAIAERLRAHNIPCILQSGIKIEGVASLFDRDMIEKTFKRNGVVVFSGGIGNPYFSTDTTSALRAIQIDAEFVFKMTKVDGIYSKDPIKFNDAKKYTELTYDEIIKENLEIMDLTGILLLKKNNIKLMVFKMNDFSLLEKAFNGENAGTIVEK